MHLAGESKALPARMAKRSTINKQC